MGDERGSCAERGTDSGFPTAFGGQCAARDPRERECASEPLHRPCRRRLRAHGSRAGMNRKLILAASAFVFLAATGVQGVHADNTGWGKGDISGFTVSDVHYSLTGADTVSGVSFRLDAVAKTVQVRLTASERWHDCAVSGRNVTCRFQGRQVPVRALQALAVTAVA